MLDWISSKMGLKPSSTAANSAPGRSGSKPNPAAPATRVPSNVTPTNEWTLPESVLFAGRDILLGKVDEVLANLPLLSASSRKAYEASLEPDVSYDQLERLIVQDSSLAATVLQQANSVRYAGARPVETVGEAINRLGLQGLRDILMVVSSQKLLRIPGSQWRTERLQARGPAVGYCARYVAQSIGVDADACFVAGLLHDLGWPAAYEAGRRLGKFMPRELVEAPEGLLQLAAFSHESVGQRLAHRWNLSPRTVSAIGNHHNPRNAPPQHVESAWVVAAAIKLVDSVGWYPETTVLEILDEPIIRQVGLSTRDVAVLTRTLRRDLELNAEESVA